MKLTLKLKSIPYVDCQFCFFDKLKDCSLLDGTKFDCRRDDCMYIMDGFIAEDNKTLNLNIPEE
jgi:hypothetical protein